MKTRVLIFLFMLCSLSLGAQIRLEGYRQADINPELLTGRWKARWISMPGEPANVYGVYHMRKTFELGEVPSRFIVHVTADNRYKLYLNGRFVSLGPARGDIYNWNFETVDLAPYLKRGKTCWRPWFGIMPNRSRLHKSVLIRPDFSCKGIRRLRLWSIRMLPGCA